MRGVIALIGLGVVTVGVACIYWPAALVVLGLGLYIDAAASRKK